MNKILYGIKIQCKEVMSASGETIMQEENSWVYVVDEEYIGGGSADGIDNSYHSSKDLLTFTTFKKAEAFAKKWKGHPWWIEPKGYKIIELTEKFKQVFDGYDIKEIEA